MKRVKHYISLDEYRERLEAMSSEDLQKELDKQIGIEASIEDIEDDVDTFINELVAYYKQAAGSRI